MPAISKLIHDRACCSGCHMPLIQEENERQARLDIRAVRDESQHGATLAPFCERASLLLVEKDPLVLKGTNFHKTFLPALPQPHHCLVHVDERDPLPRRSLFLHEVGPLPRSQHLAKE